MVKFNFFLGQTTEMSETKDCTTTTTTTEIPIQVPQRSKSVRAGRIKDESNNQRFLRSVRVLLGMAFQMKYFFPPFFP